MTASILAEAIRTLQDGGITNARQEARWLLKQILDTDAGQPRRPADSLSPEQEELLRSRLSRRVAGEPLQYIMGNVDFHCVRLDVGPGVLIPRPETEQLVEIAISLYPGNGEICDVCTGSGAIALALATTFPQTKITATDISARALAWAEQNASRLQLTNVTFHQGDLLAPTPPTARFALITANPPYVAPDEYAHLERTIKDHEPPEALIADDHGQAIIKRLARDARSRLTPGAWLVCEIGDTQGAPLKEHFRRQGYQNIDIKRDFAGRDRFIIAQQPV
ncbi:MAG: peptide chain release factor N(5)-glutamine methyltransferase [Lentisphaeria bacterium]|jgi:release factor glutamine methyltransferase